MLEQNTKFCRSLVAIVMMALLVLPVRQGQAVVITVAGAVTDSVERSEPLHYVPVHQHRASNEEGVCPHCVTRTACSECAIACTANVPALLPSVALPNDDRRALSFQLSNKIKPRNSRTPLYRPPIG